MDYFVQQGLGWIIAIQGWGAWLETPMKFFSFLGVQEFFFLVLPLIYWCVDVSLGLRVAFILLTSNLINSMFKLAFADPRPYWVSDKVRAFAAESTFGIPSGHAQNAVAVWGVIAYGIRRRWAWIAALALAFFIGFSRLYLGVHFVHDVIAGWVLGGVTLWAFIRFADPVAERFKRQSFGTQAATVFIISLLLIGLGMFSAARLGGYVLPEAWKLNALRANEMPDPVSIKDFVTSGGVFLGLALGAAWIASQGGYQAEGPAGKRVLRYVVGLIGVVILLFGLDFVFPKGETLIPFVFRYLRYFLVGFWITAGAPGLFFRIKLADKPKM